MKYLIIPKNEIAMEINARNKEDAIVAFAGLMDLDMNTYFQVVTENEYKEIKEKRKWEARKETQIDFYIDELYSFTDVPEKDMNSIAERAYEAYSNIGKYPFPDNATEYECLEWAVDEYLDRRS